MTSNEETFMRELRQLLREHAVRLDIYNPGGFAEIDLIGPDIELSIETVAEELKQP